MFIRPEGTVEDTAETPLDSQDFFNTCYLSYLATYAHENPKDVEPRALEYALGLCAWRLHLRALEEARIVD